MKSRDAKEEVGNMYFQIALNLISTFSYKNIMHGFLRGMNPYLKVLLPTLNTAPIFQNGNPHLNRQPPVHFGNLVDPF